MGVALAAVPLRQLLRYLVGVTYQYFVREVVVLFSCGQNRPGSEGLSPVSWPSDGA
jgi:hypothetical protein